MGGEGHLWATALLRRKEEPSQRREHPGHDHCSAWAQAPRPCLPGESHLAAVSFWSLPSFRGLLPLGRDLPIYIHSVVQENSKSKPKPHPNLHHWRQNRNVSLQELPSLGEADGVVASFQVRVRGELPAHLPHLVVGVHEEAVLHVLAAR